MKKILKSIAILSIIGSMMGCFSTKKFDKDVPVSVKTDFIVTIKNTGISSFSKKHTEEEYKKMFIDEFTKALSLKRIIITTTNPEYNIEITNLDLTESTRMDTVKDVKSPDDKQVYELTTGTVKANGTILLAADNTKENIWDGTESRREKFTSFRNVEEIVKGENSDSNRYREKRFGDHEYLQMVSRSAFEAAENIARKIKHNLKY